MQAKKNLRHIYGVCLNMSRITYGKRCSEHFLSFAFLLSVPTHVISLFLVLLSSKAACKTVQVSAL